MSWECLLLPDSLPSARKLPAEDFLWLHMGRWQCDLVTQSDPVDGWQTGVELKSKDQSDNFRRWLVESERKHQGNKLSDGELQAETSSSEEIKMRLPSTASMQLHLCFDLNVEKQQWLTLPWYPRWPFIHERLNLNEWQGHSHNEVPQSQWHLTLEQHTGTVMPWKHTGLIVSDFL